MVETSRTSLILLSNWREMQDPKSLPRSSSILSCKPFFCGTASLLPFFSESCLGVESNADHPLSCPSFLVISLSSVLFIIPLTGSIAPSIFRQPLVTGTSVLGLVYADGVMLAADNLGEFFSTICRLAASSGRLSSEI